MPVSTHLDSQFEVVPKLVLCAMTTKPTANSEVSVVFPAYNEVDFLEPAVEKTTEALNQFTDSYEIIIAEDGSPMAQQNEQKN